MAPAVHLASPETGRSVVPARLGRLLGGAALAALVLHAGHTGLGLGGAALDGFFNDWVYNLLMLSAAAACLARGILVSKERAAWLILGAGALAWSAGDAYYTLFLAQLENPPSPSVSDVLFLSFYPACYLGLALLVRSRIRQFHTSLWLDAVIAALAVSTVGAAVLYHPVSQTLGGNTLTTAVTLAYPLGDVLLLALVVGVFALTGWRPGRTWALVGAGLALGALGDGLYLFLAGNGTYTEGTILDTVWPASVLLLAYGAWQPGRAAEVRLEGMRILALPIAFSMVAVAMRVYAKFVPLNDVALALATATLLALIARMGVTLRENVSMLVKSREEALTDPLTGLGNRRRLMADLESELELATSSAPRMLMLFDLDGFKSYNDAYGHPAGDSLLARLGSNLGAMIAPHGRAYRLGGDEFCAVVSTDGADAVLAAATTALTESGPGFDVTTSYGTVALPNEADSATLALQIADQRMYACKDGRSSSARQQTRDVLLEVVRERQPDLHEHVSCVADMALAVARKLDTAPEELDVIARAAELHDIGKTAIPRAILDKPGTLSDEEWEFMRRHTILGERILNAAPALRPVAKLVRSSHERWDGKGYPDGLAGEAIPRGSRIVSVCDAFDAMVSDRPYRPAVPRDEALAELRRCAGTQFDPQVVEAFCEEIERRSKLPARVAAEREAEEQSSARERAERIWNASQRASAGAFK